MGTIPGTDIEKPVVRLVGEDGNVFSIMGRVQRALRKAGCSKEVIDQYIKESTSGNYDNALRTAMKFVEGE